MWKKLTAAGLALSLTISGYFAIPQSVWAQGTVQIGVLIHGLAALTLPFQTTDTVAVERSSVGFKTPAGSFLQTANNLSDIPTTSNGAGGTLKTTARNNIGGAVSTAYVSITDFAGADPTGATSSDAPFVSCITSGKDCRIPSGTFLISCINHNSTLPSSTAPITIFGDDWHTSSLKIAAGCTLPTTGLITLANVKDLTINVNSAIATSSAPIISSFSGTSGIASPVYRDVHMINVGAAGSPTNANILGIQVGSTSAVNVTAPVVTRNSYTLTAGGTSSTTINNCIVIIQGAGTVLGGTVDSNFCNGSAIDAAGSGVTFSNNQISNWAYRGGIFIEQQTNTNNNKITNNTFFNGGVVVVNGVPTDGIVNWGAGTVISGNQCKTVGGVCVANGGQNSSITGNWSIGTGKRNDAAGGAAYFSNFQNTTFNGNGSMWSGNYGADDGTHTTTEGFADATGSSNLNLIGNDFPSLIPYFLND